MKTKQSTEEKVFAYIRKHHMLEPGDRVVAGISGGADSVCLLFVLLEWAKRVPLELTVVHVNHGIRAEAGEDARYVEELCKLHSLPYYLVEKDIRQLARERKCSEEEAGRQVRYEAFSDVSDKVGANKIAVAHNSNDRSETMLFHLFRGSGIKGLSSIQPVRENIIRPILCLEREEIEAYLQVRGIAYCRDVTNATDDYTRNRIRHHIIPYVEREIVSGCVQHMATTAELLSETEDYLELQTAAAMEQCVQKKENLQDGQEAFYRVSVTQLSEQHPTIQKRVLHHLVKELAPGHRDISHVHIVDLLELFTGRGNRTVCLPFAIRGRREYEYVYIERSRETEQEKMAPDGQNRFLFTVLPEGAELIQNEYTKCFDYDKIKGYPTVRCRQKGDYLTITDSRGRTVHKSLKDYMIDQKIPRGQRDILLLLAQESHIIWLPGYRVSEYYKISENTKRILQVQLITEKPESGETEENNGRTC